MHKKYLDKDSYNKLNKILDSRLNPISNKLGSIEMKLDIINKNVKGLKEFKLK